MLSCMFRLSTGLWYAAVAHFLLHPVCDLAGKHGNAYCFLCSELGLAHFTVEAAGYVLGTGGCFLLWMHSQRDEGALWALEKGQTPVDM